MVLSNEGKLIDNNGVEVFKNDVFNQLVNIANLSQATPNAGYVDAQANQVFFKFSDDARKYVEYQVSKLIDDNASLASDDNVKNQYVMNVIALLAILNKISKDGPVEVKNEILGGVFPTKDDNSSDSMIPIYLCVEMLEAKCLKYLGLSIENLEELNFDSSSQSSKTSNLRDEFDKVITRLKDLDYDKTMFNQDMSDGSVQYLSECQVASDGSVDIFAKIDETEGNIKLYVTQARADGNNFSQNIVMCELKNTNEKTSGGVENAQENVADESNAVVAGVPVISNDNVQVNYSNPEQVSNLSNSPTIVNAVTDYNEKRDRVTKLKEELEELQKELENAENAEQAAADQLANLFVDSGEVSQKQTPNPISL
ncbi:MAG: hypothetical protein IKO49_08240 [Bacilli bacterium]|nr:hypothetical protein [Bacilli bacterium]